MEKCKDMRTGHLGPDAKVIADLIIEKAFVLLDCVADGGGCSAFHNPADFSARENRDYHDASLVVVFDGGDLYYLLSYDSETPHTRDLMIEHIELHGYICEHINNWSMTISKN